MIKIVKNIFSGLFQEIDADIGLLPERRTVSAQDPSHDRGGKSKEFLYLLFLNFKLNIKLTNFFPHQFCIYSLVGLFYSRSRSNERK